MVTGPVEATALGNLLVQVRASGELSSLAEMREVIRNSSDVNATSQNHRQRGPKRRDGLPRYTARKDRNKT